VARKRYPGVMNSVALPAPGRMRPASSTADSSVRTQVVPTAMMRPPLARAPLMAPDASGLTS